MKKLLMGNEAIALGAVEAGVKVASAYPGTPSSEVLSTIVQLAKDKEIYTEWSVNEKVALEVAVGASYAGARSLVAMKQVGLNVASDPLMSLAYIGIKGGMVLVVADDPGPHSSQTEQDTRKFAQFAKIPVLDPSTPSEARDMVKYAFKLSEELMLPVVLRPTTRTCHVCQDIEIAVNEQKIDQSKVYFEKDPKWVILPGLSARKHPWLNRQQEEAKKIFDQSSFNKLDLDKDSDIGIITSGVSYNYVKEALTLAGLKASVLKIGTPYPLPSKLLTEMFGKVKRILVVEEQEPVVEDQIIALAWKLKSTAAISGKHDCLVPREGELNTDKVKGIIEKFYGIERVIENSAPAPELPLRMPVLCAGCPHRSSFYIFKEATKGTDTIFTGDIGCYTLGAAAPLEAVDTCLCMGASISIAAGLNRAEPGRKQIAFLGDSTFFHSGISGLINSVYNQANITTVVLDNRTTAMTGHQPHPGLGVTASGTGSKSLDIARIAEACGVEFVREINPYDLESCLPIVREAINYPGPSVIIMKKECISLVRPDRPYFINPDICINCGICIEEFGCPAITRGSSSPEISKNCSGCGVCAQICPTGAIERTEQ